eukprot:CAMPEP_0198651616 /NCGR_PEP_ID=MMETSP1467-20131203/5813_1 /TAXON_ID=1462469 /ORGANISM="unid. sp., Strain CCMP2135" /LENGTH=258 /DNA_ID=CAMNT_0044387515 /DNA_START=18 /DNA_END=790 /DNA_ORIENTATION=+
MATGQQEATMTGFYAAPPGTPPSGAQPGADLHKLDMSSFKQRNSAILETLQAQEQERDSLWAALQKARLDGEKLREEADRKGSVEDEVSMDDETMKAPTNADLMAMIDLKESSTLPSRFNKKALEEQPTAPARVPSRFANRPNNSRKFRSQDVPRPKEEKRRSRSKTPVLAEGFICPTCWMRAPSAEVLRRHYEEVHQTFLERATNRVLDNTGAIGNMTRQASRKIRRSLSLRPQPSLLQNAQEGDALDKNFRRAAYV